MQIVIDIPEDVYTRLFDSGVPTSLADGIVIDRAIRTGTPIPDNATNGEVIKAIFPYYSYERNDYVQSTEDYIVDSMECMEHDLYFAYDWWNAPYQKGGK